MKHKHNWQFKEEVKYPSKVIEPSCFEKVMGVLSPIISTPIVFYDYYNVFCCECGKEKEVKIK